MPLRLKIKKELTARSDRVKSVDIFPAENPWVLAALYSGNVYIWDYSTNTMVKSFETGTNPVRCAKFIVRKQWIIAATDDMKLRVFNYNTMDKVKEWEAHTDYIRYLEVHPNRPYVLSSSDDMSIKLWDWEKDFECVQVFEGHSHYVMMVKINPRDTNTFASASLDKTIKVWGLTAGTAHFSLDGPGSHEKGVNCIDYYPGGDKPYLLSGADDRTIKVWDYQTKACLQTLEGHSHNVSSVCFHPRLPVILSSSEDGTVRIWHSTTYRPETTLNYGLERAWAIAVTKDSNKVAIGYDEGTIVLKLGNERPVASLDTNSGKLMWAENHDIQTVSLKGISKSSDIELVDGERVPINARELGACEVYPQSLQHNSNGSFVVICGDGEYIIYTSQALRNKAFGSALDFVWSAQGSGDYAIRESISRVRTFKNFKEHRQINLPVSSADGIFGGACLAVKGPDCVVFFDWDEGQFIRKIDVNPIAIYWNESGDNLVIACMDTFYVLRYDRDIVAAALSSGQVNPEEGVNGSFELITTVNERVFTGQWVGECFLYTNGNRKLNYIVGGETMTLCHLNSPMYLLGYVPKEDRVFLIDKSYNIVSYKLLLSVLSYQTAVVRQDFETANSLLPLIPKSEYGSVAKFLESQGFKEEALAVTTDLDHKFELAIDLKKMSIAHEVLQAVEKTTSEYDAESTETQSRWRRLGDLALMNGDIHLAETCAKRSHDLSGLLLLYSAVGYKQGMLDLAAQSKEAGRLNVAFLGYFLTGRVEDALQLLIDANRIPEAGFFARTYLPSYIPRILELWKQDLKQVNEKAAEALADPVKYPNLFPDYEWALKVEQMFLQHRNNFVPATAYLTARKDLDLDLIELVKQQSAMQSQIAQAEAKVEMMSLESKQENVPEPNIAEPEDVSVASEASEAEEEVAEVVQQEPTKEDIPSIPQVPASPQRVLPPSPPRAAESHVVEKEVIHQPSPALHTQEQTQEEDLDDLLDEDEEEEEEKANVVSQPPPSPPRVIATTPIKTPSAVVESETAVNAVKASSVSATPASAKKPVDDDDLDFDDDDLLEDDHSSPQHYNAAAAQAQNTTPNDPDEFESDEDW